MEVERTRAGHARSQNTSLRVRIGRAISEHPPARDTNGPLRVPSERERDVQREKRVIEKQKQEKEATKKKKDETKETKQSTDGKSTKEENS